MALRWHVLHKPTRRLAYLSVRGVAKSIIALFERNNLISADIFCLPYNTIRLQGMGRNVIRDMSQRRRLPQSCLLGTYALSQLADNLKLLQHMLLNCVCHSGSDAAPKRMRARSNARYGSAG